VKAGRVAIVGRGRVGTALVAALPAAAGPFGRGFDGAGYDVVVVAVPDREIAAASTALGRRDGLVVGHCSGATSIDALGDHERFGLHPLMTVPPGAGVDVFHGSPAAISASSPQALAVAHELARRLQMQPFEIEDRHRAAYHAAASIASNYLVTVEDAAEVVLRAIGLDRSILAPLVRASLDNWVTAGRDSLTGPIARGDDGTVERHRAAIAALAPELVDVVDALIARTRAIAG
jgi:predicted short-subunit dehydrogenase-like oxidoreductase (DUF2520 family)